MNTEITKVGGGGQLVEDRAGFATGVGCETDDSEILAILAIPTDAVNEDAQLAQVCKFEVIVAIHDCRGFRCDQLIHTGDGEVARRLIEMLAFFY